MEEIVYLNGSLLPRSQAAISPFDHGFLYGYGVFETLRSYSGRFFRLSAHLERLYRSLEMLQIKLPLPAPELEAALYRLIEANGLPATSGRVRLTVSAGAAEAAPEPAPTRATLFIAARPHVPIPAARYEKGYRAITVSPGSNRFSFLSRVKSCNYLNFLLASREAHAQGCDEALLLNDRGCLVEGSATNLFLVREGRLVTPDLDSGPLPGITRGVVIEIASHSGLAAAEREINYAELKEVQEAFLTSSVLEIMPLVSVDGQAIGRGVPGEITRSVMAAYQELVAQETAINPVPGR